MCFTKCVCVCVCVCGYAHLCRCSLIVCVFCLSQGARYSGRISVWSAGWHLLVATLLWPENLKHPEYSIVFSESSQFPH